MKKLPFLLSVLSIVVLASCKEIGPAINTGNVQADPEDTTYVVASVPSPEPRNVLIEEFTGVSCPNCPAGHDIVRSLKQSNPGRIVAIGLYKFGTPLTERRQNSKYDFRDSIANIIDNQIYEGTVSSLPSAGIDRVAHDNVKMLDRAKWSKAAADRLGISSPVNLSVSSTHNDADNSVKVKFTATFTREVSGPVFFTVAIVEDGIIDVQEKGLEEIEDYDHEHVFRGIISANKVSGVELAADGIYESGRVFVRTVTGTLQPTWKAEKCKVVVFLHRSGTDKEVLQAKEISLK